MSRGAAKPARPIGSNDYEWVDAHCDAVDRRALQTWCEWAGPHLAARIMHERVFGPPPEPPFWPADPMPWQ